MTLRMDCFSVNLPEQIERMKGFGDFDEAMELIEEVLNQDISGKLRDRLLLEKEIIPILRKEYPYNFEEAIEIMKGLIPDFTKEEFLDLQRAGKIDWIYVLGIPKYFRRFHLSLLKTEKNIVSRANLCTELEKEKECTEKEDALLFDCISNLKEKKKITYSFHIRHQIRIKDTSFSPGRVTVHLPLPISCMQVKESKIVFASPQTYEVADDFVLQRTVCFEKVQNTNEPFEIEYQYQNTVTYLVPDSGVVSESMQPDLRAREFWGDLGKQEPHVRFTPFLRALAQEIVETETNVLKKARKIYDYITKNVKYSYIREYITIQNLPEYAALNRKGDCGAQSLLFITLCRIVGIPARWQSGLFTTPYSAKSHDWAMFYVAPYGWLFVDCSFGGIAYCTYADPLLFDFRKKEEARIKWDFYFGNLDPFRMPSCSDFQRDFSGPRKYLRNDPFDNQRGEVEYKDRALGYDELVTEISVLEAIEVPSL